MRQKTKSCLIACSVLKDEIDKLVQSGELDVDLRFVSKYFHVDYAQVEKHVRLVVENALKQYPGNVILVYGDLCMGMDDEMKKLCEEYGIVKVDAVNCIDCQLGGKGIFLKTDPHSDLMFLSPGMTDFFRHAQEMMRREGLDDATLTQLFCGLRGIVLLDTLGNIEVLKSEVDKLNTGLPILKIESIGCTNVKNVIQEAIERNEKRKSVKS
jgi:hypothetical protein